MKTNERLISSPPRAVYLRWSLDMDMEQDN